MTDGNEPSGPIRLSGPSRPSEPSGPSRPSRPSEPSFLARAARRCVPQRIGPRLTLVYATLFLVAGLALLGLTYGLVDASLPPPPKHLLTKNQQLKVTLDCAAQEKTDAAVKGCVQKAFAAGVGPARPISGTAPCTAFSCTHCSASA